MTYAVVYLNFLTLNFDCMLDVVCKYLVIANKASHFGNLLTAEYWA